MASVDEAIAQVQKLGGSVLREKTAVPKKACYAVPGDPERPSRTCMRPARAGTSLKAGATPEEIMTVLQICVSMGVEACAK
jgi:hypothetical protein